MSSIPQAPPSGPHGAAAQTPLESELAQLLVEALNLDTAAAEIDPQAPLYGEGLGLDSIDILEVALVVSQGAEMVDIGGIKAAPGVEIGAAEEKSRVVDFVARVREAFPDLVISVDTWRASVGAAAAAVGIPDPFNKTRRR